MCEIVYDQDEEGDGYCYCSRGMEGMTDCYPSAKLVDEILCQHCQYLPDRMTSSSPNNVKELKE